MTVNERLFVCGLMDQFDQARQDRNLDVLRALFAQIALPDYPIETLVTDAQD